MGLPDNLEACSRSIHDLTGSRWCVKSRTTAVKIASTLMVRHAPIACKLGVVGKLLLLEYK